MKRTTVYLPEELKERLEAEARRRGVTEAQVIREAVDKETRRPRPRGGILTGGTIDAQDIDDREGLRGFGET
jgi:predicted transcriptional regulator